MSAMESKLKQLQNIFHLNLNWGKNNNKWIPIAVARAFVQFEVRCKRAGAQFEKMWETRETGKGQSEKGNPKG